MIANVEAKRTGVIIGRETTPLLSRESFSDSEPLTVIEEEIPYQDYNGAEYRKNGGLKLIMPDTRVGDDTNSDGMLSSGVTTPLTPAERVVRMLESSGEFFEPVSLAWRNINVFAPNENTATCCRKKSNYGPTQILKNVTGYANAGKVLAIMGASGGGKTTLLNVLNYRNRGTLTVDGDIRINGMDIGRAIKNISAYVQQNDVFIGMLTVKEHLIFRAMLRMDKKLTKSQRLQRVKEVMTELGLTKCANTLIGVPGRSKGISGGEMKRLSFASEILTNPPLIFCDEPTSGLDSFMAASVIQLLKNMAAKKRTIVCVIHQPSSDVYNMFDDVLYMAEGRVAYMGEIPKVVPYFNSLGYKCPENYNPADYIINTLAIVPGKEYECRQKVVGIVNSFQESDLMRKIDETVFRISEKSWSEMITFNAEFIDGSRYVAPWFRQFWYVIWRTVKAQSREPYIFKLRAFQVLIITLVVGAIYYRDQSAIIDQNGIKDINGLLFFVLTNLSFTYMFVVLEVFFDEIPIFLREQASAVYCTSSYFVGKNVADLPFYTLFPLVLTTGMYWLGGLVPTAESFVVFVAISLLLVNVNTGFGYLMSVSVTSFEIALLIMPTIALVMMMVAGFFINIQSIIPYLRWLQYVSWFRYGNEAYMINQWGGMSSIACSSVNKTSIGDEACLSNGEEILASFGFDAGNMWLDIGMMVALMVLFRVLAFGALCLRAHRTAM